MCFYPTPYRPNCNNIAAYLRKLKMLFLIQYNFIGRTRPYYLLNRSTNTNWIWFIISGTNPIPMALNPKFIRYDSTKF
jgi:hypothetical protein